MPKQRVMQLIKINVAMLAFVAFGYFTLATVDRLRSAWTHTGPSVLAIGEDGEIVREVSESKYRRHHITMSAMMLALELLVWAAVATRLRRSVYGDD